MAYSMLAANNVSVVFDLLQTVHIFQRGVGCGARWTTHLRLARTAADMLCVVYGQVAWAARAASRDFTILVILECTIYHYLLCACQLCRICCILCYAVRKSPYFYNSKNDVT